MLEDRGAHEGKEKTEVDDGREDTSGCHVDLVVPAHPRDPPGGETDCDVRGVQPHTKLGHNRASAHSRVAAQAGTTKDRCGYQALGSAGAIGVS